MEPAQAAAARTGAEPELRSHVRFPVDEDATLLVLNRNQLLRCRVINLSQNGCRIHSRELRLATGTNVEITFKVNGIGFRFSGNIRWNQHNHAGIHFPRRLSRQSEDLRLVLAELEIKVRQKEAEAAAAAPPPPIALPVQPSQDTPQSGTSSQLGEPQPALLPQRAGKLLEMLPDRRPPQPADAPPHPAKAPAAPTSSPVPAAASPAHVQQPSQPPVVTGRDRRVHARESIDTSAILFVVKSGSRIDGRIVNLSPGGCCVQASDRFTLGIYTRVEVEFRLQGLPLRLGGVIQAVREQRVIGVRFLDMSERKHAQVAELIAEIHDLHQSEPGAGEPGAAP